MLSCLVEKVSPGAVTQLDPFPISEPFTRLRQKQVEVCEQVGGNSLAENIEQFLSSGNKCLSSVRTEGLKFLQKSLNVSKLEIPYLLKQGAYNEHVASRFHVA